MAISRNSWKDSGQFFSEFGVSIRCVRNDQIGAVSGFDLFVYLFLPLILNLSLPPSLPK